MFRKVLNSQETKEIAHRAISTIAAVVKKTLGPGGNPIILERSGQNPDGSPISPLVTKDGVTVAQHVTLRDPALNTIAKTILQVAQKTVEDGGDGTTTSVVLAEAIYKAGYKHIEQGQNSIDLYNQLKEIKDEVIAELDKQKTPVKDSDVINVARISANGDEEIADIVYRAIKAAGEDGYVRVEDGYTRDTQLVTVEGSVYQRGWRNFAPNGVLLVNDKARNVCELTNPAVLLYAGKLDSLKDFESFLAMVWKYNEQLNTYDDVIPLMIVAHDFSDDIKNKILQIRAVGKLPIAAIKSPADGSPNARTEMLEDLAVMLGASVASQGILDLANVKDEHLGSAGKVEIGPEETVFFDGSGSKESIIDRINELNQLLATGNLHPFDADNVRYRKGKLSGGIAIVKVGGVSELEMRERKDRIDDALCAAKVSIQDGILPGGGYALYKIAKRLEKRSKGIRGTTAQAIMAEALQAPIKHIIENSGEKPDVILTMMPRNKGFDARRKKFVNLMDSGIVDPAKVTKSALENAVSIAGLLLTTGGALVSDISPDDGKSNPLAAMMGLG